MAHTLKRSHFIIGYMFGSSSSHFCHEERVSNKIILSSLTKNHTNCEAQFFGPVGSSSTMNSLDDYSNGTCKTTGRNSSVNKETSTMQQKWIQAHHYLSIESPLSKSLLMANRWRAFMYCFLISTACCYTASQS